MTIQYFRIFTSPPFDIIPLSQKLLIFHKYKYPPIKIIIPVKKNRFEKLFNDTLKIKKKK